jgi:hypothetical protein
VLAASGIEAGRELPRKLNKTSQAAVAWLTSKDLDAFDHLVAICFRAKGNLFIPARGETLVDSTRKWICDFLLDFLFPYHHATYAEIEEAAERGAFWHIARLCRLRMLDEIRKRTALERKPPPTLSLDQPIGSDEEGNELTPQDFIGTAPENAGQSPLGRQRPLEELEIAIELYENGKALLELLGEIHLRALKAILCAYLNDVLPVTAISQRLGVKKSQAYKYKGALARKMQSGLKQGNPGAQTLYKLIDSQYDPIVQSWLKHDSSQRPSMDEQEAVVYPESEADEG